MGDARIFSKKFLKFFEEKSSKLYDFHAFLAKNGFSRKSQRKTNSTPKSKTTLRMSAKVVVDYAKPMRFSKLKSFADRRTTDTPFAVVFFRNS